ncbi:MAG TPA: SUMF1/EgtB/PvdO family nonheme iron enzyme [Candidatus Sumerlaeota bacterium]|nr:SUMF1/EgtB/PvdO family nonheme iron enzyme [Candidatus Sumerlaeota bacterium]
MRKKNPTGPASGASRVLRGGSWFADPGLCRSASRYWPGPATRSDFSGFRVVSPR